jgi:hypothetical protein
MSDTTPDLIWIRSSVEMGLDIDEEYLSIPRAQWEAMTADEKSDYLAEVAVEHQNNVAPAGASVVDIDEVPDSYLDQGH